MTNGERDFGAMVKAERLRRGLSIAAAAKAAGIRSENTWSSAEKGESISDLTRTKITKFLGLADSPDEISPRDARDLTGWAREQLNPELAEFSDVDLLREIQIRLLVMGTKLTELGAPALTWRIDDDGEPAIASALPR